MSGIRSNGDTFNICNFKVSNLDKIRIGGCDMNSEELTLKYDKDFIGEHIFDVLIANDQKHYIKDDIYSLNIVGRSKIGFSIIQFGDTLELRNEKYITDEFINSWINKQEKSSPINTDLDKEKAEFGKEK